MLIESLIKRTGGTVIELEAPKAAYHFKPTDTDDRHIADVDVSHHAKTLLRIKEGFRAVDDVDLNDDDQGKGEDTGRNLVGSNVHNAEYTILGGDVISLDDLVGMAFEDSGLEEQAWNDLADQERYDFINTTLKELQDGEHGDEQGAATHTDQTGGTEQQPETERTDDAAQEADAGHSDETAPVGESSTDGAAAADVNDNGINDNLESMTRKDLEPLYVKKFGRKPSSAMKVEDIKRALSEDDD
jgi:nitrite reductase/ring-hydroxylating ferredoxin subunit